MWIAASLSPDIHKDCLSIYSPTSFPGPFLLFLLQLLLRPLLPRLITLLAIGLSSPHLLAICFTMATTKPVNAYSRQKHTVRLKDWALSLKEAIDALLPSGTKRYRQVAVIGFHWENDDMGVSSLEDNLLNIFKDIYNFNTESYTIPTANCASSLQIKLGTWSQHWARPDVLRIYVYSGHAGPASTTDNRWYIA